tara:strand:+ start:2297 stop:2629 length:333 start_codon:yes stop_codon:yes gene_type:complete
MKHFNEFINESSDLVNENYKKPVLPFISIEANLDKMFSKSIESLAKQLSKRISKKYKGSIVQTDTMVQPGQIEEIIIDQITTDSQEYIKADSRIIVDTGEAIRHTFFLMI